MWADNHSWAGNIKSVPEELVPPTVIVQNPPVKEYVVGFMFSPSKQTVVLIEKQRPEWQKGKLNGVGGKIEIGETPRDVMQREFQEETGIAYWGWHHFATLRGAGTVVYVFRAFSELAFWAETKTDEKVFAFFPDPLPTSVLPNLRFLIPLALTPGYAHTEFRFEE